ncbi:terpenoid synthase [Agrocybe pediades]|nr:terpenoid synthase [Agrocybe pediades]
MLIKFDEPEQKMHYLPRTMDNWPWPRAINPYYKDISAQSDAWFHGFKAFNEKSQRAFDMCDFEQLRTGCDLMNLFFVVDEYTDVEPAHVVREMVDIVIDALNNPDKPRPEGEILLGELTRQFWDRGRKTATPSAAMHMVESLTAYLNSCVEQAADRDNNRYRTVDEYLKNRRENVGIRPSFVPMALAMDFPDRVFHHPVIVELSIYIADLIILDNDIVSYNREQATGDDRHNILTIVMRQFGLDLDGALEWVAQYHEEVRTRFLDGLKRVPSWGGEIDKNMEVYINGLGNWPRCNDCWNFESGRYFGKKGPEFQKTRWVPLLPKVAELQDPAAKAKKENIVIPMFFDSVDTEEQTDT